MVRIRLLPGSCFSHKSTNDVQSPSAGSLAPALPPTSPPPTPPPILITQDNIAPSVPLTLEYASLGYAPTSVPQTPGKARVTVRYMERTAEIAWYEDPSLGEQAIRVLIRNAFGIANGTMFVCSDGDGDYVPCGPTLRLCQSIVDIRLTGGAQMPPTPLVLPSTPGSSLLPPWLHGSSGDSTDGYGGSGGFGASSRSLGVLPQGNNLREEQLLTAVKRISSEHKWAKFISVTVNTVAWLMEAEHVSLHLVDRKQGQLVQVPGSFDVADASSSLRGSNAHASSSASTPARARAGVATSANSPPSTLGFSPGDRHTGLAFLISLCMPSVPEQIYAAVDTPNASATATDTDSAAHSAPDHARITPLSATSAPIVRTALKGETTHAHDVMLTSSTSSTETTGTEPSWNVLFVPVKNAQKRTIAVLKMAVKNLEPKPTEEEKKSYADAADMSTMEDDNVSVHSTPDFAPHGMSCIGRVAEIIGDSMERMETSYRFKLENSKVNDLAMQMRFLAHSNNPINLAESLVRILKTRVIHGHVTAFLRLQPTDRLLLVIDSEAKRHYWSSEYSYSAQVAMETRHGFTAVASLDQCFPTELFEVGFSTMPSDDESLQFHTARRPKKSKARTTMNKNKGTDPKARSASFHEGILSHREDSGGVCAENTAKNHLIDGERRRHSAHEVLHRRLNRSGGSEGGGGGVSDERVREGQQFEETASENESDHESLNSIICNVLQGGDQGNNRQHDATTKLIPAPHSVMAYPIIDHTGMCFGVVQVTVPMYINGDGKVSHSLHDATRIAQDNENNSNNNNNNNNNKTKKNNKYNNKTGQKSNTPDENVPIFVGSPILHSRLQALQHSPRFYATKNKNIGTPTNSSSNNNNNMTDKHQGNGSRIVSLFGRMDTKYMAVLARSVAPMISKAAHAQLDDQSQRLYRTLYQIVSYAANSKNNDQYHVGLVALLCKSVKSLICAERVSILVVNKVSEELVSVPTPDEPIGFEVPMRKTNVPGYVAMMGQPAHYRCRADSLHVSYSTGAATRDFDMDTMNSPNNTGGSRVSNNDGDKHPSTSDGDNAGDGVTAEPTPSPRSVGSRTSQWTNSFEVDPFEGQPDAAKIYSMYCIPIHGNSGDTSLVLQIVNKVVHHSATPVGLESSGLAGVKSKMSDPNNACRTQSPTKRRHSYHTMRPDEKLRRQSKSYLNRSHATGLRKGSLIGTSPTRGRGVGVGVGNDAASESSMSDCEYIASFTEYDSDFDLLRGSFDMLRRGSFEKEDGSKHHEVRADTSEDSAEDSSSSDDSSEERKRLDGRDGDVIDNDAVAFRERLAHRQRFGSVDNSPAWGTPVGGRENPDRGNISSSEMADVFRCCARPTFNANDMRMMKIFFVKLQDHLVDVAVKLSIQTGKSQMQKQLIELYTGDVSEGSSHGNRQIVHSTPNTPAHAMLGKSNKGKLQRAYSVDISASVEQYAHTTKNRHLLTNNSDSESISSSTPSSLDGSGPLMIPPTLTNELRINQRLNSVPAVEPDIYDSVGRGMLTINCGSGVGGIKNNMNGSLSNDINGSLSIGPSLKLVVSPSGKRSVGRRQVNHIINKRKMSLTVKTQGIKPSASPAHFSAGRNLLTSPDTEHNNNKKQESDERIWQTACNLFRAQFAKVSGNPADQSMSMLNQYDLNVFELSLYDLRTLTSSLLTSEIAPLRALRIDPDKLTNFIASVQRLYRDNAFHTFYHGFSVLHQTWLLLNRHCVRDILTPVEHICALLSALCHDIDHPGSTNKYETNAMTMLAIRYSEKAVLERHHCHIALKLMLRSKNSDIFSHLLKSPEIKEVRQLIVQNIMGTDMLKHFEHVSWLATAAGKRRVFAEQTHGMLDTVYHQSTCVYAQTSSVDVGGASGEHVSNNDSPTQSASSASRAGTPTPSILRSESGVSNASEAGPRKGGSGGIGGGGSGHGRRTTLINFRSPVAAHVLRTHGEQQQLRVNKSHSPGSHDMPRCDCASMGPSVAEVLDASNREERAMLGSVLLHCADLSAQTLPWSVALEWGIRVSQEFETHAAREEDEDIDFSVPVIRTDHDCVKSQIFFCKEIAQPLWLNAVGLMPALSIHLDNLQTNLHRYEELEKITRDYPCEDYAVSLRQQISRSPSILEEELEEESHVDIGGEHEDDKDEEEVKCSTPNQVPMNYAAGKYKSKAASGTGLRNKLSSKHTK